MILFHKFFDIQAINKVNFNLCYYPYVFTFFYGCKILENKFYFKLSYFPKNHRKKSLFIYINQKTNTLYYLHYVDINNILKIQVIDEIHSPKKLKYLNMFV